MQTTLGLHRKQTYYLQNIYHVWRQLCPQTFDIKCLPELGCQHLSISHDVVQPLNCSRQGCQLRAGGRRVWQHVQLRPVIRIHLRIRKRLVWIWLMSHVM